MLRSYLFNFAFLFLIGCNNSSADSTNAANHNDSSKISKGNTGDIVKEVANSSNKPDSTDNTSSNAVAFDEAYIQKAIVSKIDSSIWLTANMKLDHRIFGYEKPDTTSRKMILISIFTNDVEGNPFKCPFGSYYQTSNMTDMEIKYVSTEGIFIKASVFKKNEFQGAVYMDKKFIEFEE
ncbi:hypothetical protein QTN47_21485 [Danxiaibacter flavus]|uniref:Lipoprotein n=1 Tax=Danxiaibacter flavus TaxID=3049108 RepID=A0ABV3ZJP7_9BACT|nr:hypothetical protein QNM32_21490 [Chitinophagaceae bacterium DXS]